MPSHRNNIFFWLLLEFYECLPHHESMLFLSLNHQIKHTIKIFNLCSFWISVEKFIDALMFEFTVSLSNHVLPLKLWVIGFKILCLADGGYIGWMCKEYQNHQGWIRSKCTHSAFSCMLSHFQILSNWQIFLEKIK